MTDPKRVSAALMTTAGVMFLIAGLLRGFRQPVWFVLGVALLGAGAAILRGGGKQ